MVSSWKLLISAMYQSCLTLPAQPGVTILARHPGAGEGLVAVSGPPGQRRLFTALASLPLPVLRALCDESGVHRYVSRSDVLVQADAVGSSLYYGKGAGAEPTASAVIADLVDVTRMATADPENRVPHLAFQPDAVTDTPILPMAEVESGYYLRLRVEDKPGVLADITRILADEQISIDAMIQREPAEGEQQTDIIMLTHVVREKQIDAAIARIEALPVVKGKLIRLRLDDLN